MPVNRTGYMAYGGIRFNFPNDERTKLGFEFNHGSKYWFNFAQAADDIIAPKTNTRGNVLEAYLTQHLPGSAGPLAVEQFPHGHSNLTYLLRLGETELVLRRPPYGNQVKSAHDMGREQRQHQELSVSSWRKGT